MHGPSIRVPPQPAEVRQPGIRALDWPTQPHRLALRALGCSSLSLSRDDRVIDAAFGEGSRVTFES